MGVECSTNDTEEKCIQGTGRKPEKDRSINSPRHRWNNSIKMDLRGIGQQGVGCIYLADDRDKWFVHVTNGSSFSPS